jgi:hypothetical protein
MSHKCAKCNIDIPQERIEIFLELRNSIPDTCKECSFEQKVVGFMGESSVGGDKGGRKTGYVLVSIDPNSSNYKENLRRAIRCHKRSR